MKLWLKILLGIIVVSLLILIILFIKNFIGGLKLGSSQIQTVPEATSSLDYSREYPVSDSTESGFEKTKKGQYFVAYYHPNDETNANKSLVVLEQEGVDLYQTYLGIKPVEIPVYLAITAEEYVKTADFPGGRENVAIGDGSAPNGKIYLYKPFEDTRTGKTEGMIIHEGVHASLYQFFGTREMQNLPGFLNEGLAHYIEYVFKAGKDFKPLEQIYHADLLENSVKTGSPKLMSLEELGENCEGYIADETQNFLCRGQGTFIVWQMTKNYGNDIWSRFLTDLKLTGDWVKSLQNVSGLNISKLGETIQESLKNEVLSK